MKASSGDDNVQPTMEQSKRVQAEAYIRQVHKRFGGKSETFHAFIVLLRDFRHRRTDAASLGVKITQLFSGHDDLILEFNDFMPRRDDDDDDDDEDEDDEGEGEDDNDSEKTTPEYPVEVLQAIDFVNKVRIRFRENEHVYEAFLQIINQIREGCAEHERYINEVEALLKGHPDLLWEFGRIIGRIISDSAASHSAIGDVCSMNPENEKPGLVLAEYRSSKRSDYKRRFTFCEKIKDKLCSSTYRALLKHLEEYSSGKLDRDGLKVVIEELLKDKVDLVSLQDFLKSCESTNKSENKKHKGKCEILEETKQNMLKPVHELDLSKSQKVCPSYWFLPENYCMPLKSHRSTIGNQVLNDCLVCVNSGSENYSKQRHITQQEKILFRCEDDRFEMDMLLEYVTSASESVNKLLTKINKDQTKTSTMKVEDYLSIFELRCIERLYGEHGLDMMELLHDDPAAALPTILCRLNQKKEELKLCRSDFDKVWAYVYAKNLNKEPVVTELQEKEKKMWEKQYESKNLSKEHLVTEFQEKEKKMQKEEDKGCNTMI